MVHQLMKSLNSFLFGLGIAGTVVTTVTAAPPTPTPGSEVYIVQADDWLSKLAQKYYDDALAYPAIVEATNAKAANDATFTPITNPDLIEIGQKLWIPTTFPASVSNPEQGILTQITELSAGADSLAFSPDDQLLAVGHSQGVDVWDTNTWQLRWSTPYSDSVREVALSPNGQRLASVSFDNTARLWEANTGQPITQLTFNHWAVSLDFSSDGRLWASGGFHDRIIMADASTGQPVKEFKPDSPVGDLALSPNGPWLAAIMPGSWGPSKVVVWDIFTEEQRTLAEFRLTAYSNVAFSPDSQWLAAGLAGDERAVAIWQTQTWPQVARLDVEDAIVDKVVFSPDGRLLVGMATLFKEWQGRIWVWEVPTWRLLFQIELPDVAWNLAFSPDSHWLAVGLGQDAVNEGQLWDVVTGDLTGRMPHDGQVLAVTFSHNGRWLVTGGGNSNVKVWQIAGY
jgi:WD40 repeat protein